MLEKTLHEELLRFKAINKYGKNMIIEQEAEVTPEPTDEPIDPATDEPIDPATDLPIEPTADDTLEMGDTTEEIDITDLVNMTKSIKNNMEDTKTEHNQVISKMDGVFSKLNDLETKLAQMDSVMAKIEQLDAKIDSVKEPTPQEKLEMRSLDSYPFNTKPNDFFSQKQGEMRASGKNEYVLTKNDINDFSLETIKNTFNPTTQEDEFEY